MPTAEALAKLADGLQIGAHHTRPAAAWILDPQPTIAPRIPPIRIRKNVPDIWLALALTEGKNHQVRRMTAVLGHPTLRLLRVQIGTFPLADLAAGTWKQLTPAERQSVFSR